VKVNICKLKDKRENTHSNKLSHTFQAFVREHLRFQGSTNKNLITV